MAPWVPRAPYVFTFLHVLREARSRQSPGFFKVLPLLSASCLVSASVSQHVGFRWYLLRCVERAVVAFSWFLSHTHLRARCLSLSLSVALPLSLSLSHSLSLSLTHTRTRARAHTHKLTHGCGDVLSRNTSVLLCVLCFHGYLGGSCRPRCNSAGVHRS